VSLDGVANDGVAGEGDNVRPDIESFGGGSGADTLDASGASESKSLHGAGGNDVLSSGAGDDDLDGGNGSDTLTAGPGDDVLWDFESIDSGDPPTDQAGDDVLNGGDGDDHMYADSALRRRASASETDRESGSGLGSNVYQGGAGEDIIYVWRSERSVRKPDSVDPADTLTTHIAVNVSLDGVVNDGWPGARFTIAGDVENVMTGDGNDMVTGNAGSNRIWGSGGNDRIDGAGGADELSGGNGIDTMVSRDLGFDRVNCGDANDTPVEGDVGDLLTQCEAANLTPLAPPPDISRPKIKLGAASAVRAATLRRRARIAVSVSPDEPARFEAELRTGPRTLPVGQTLIGRGSLRLAAGKRTLIIRMSRAHAARIARLARSKTFRRRGYPLTLTVRVQDATGHAVTLIRTIRVR